MLTVLVRNKTTKWENVFEAKSVECIDGGQLIINHSDELQSVLGASLGEHDFRDVFVMNENGKTVARYFI